MALSQQAFIHDALLNLSHSLAKLNIPLTLIISDTYADAAQKYCGLLSATSGHCAIFNHQYALNEQNRDKK